MVKILIKLEGIHAHLNQMYTSFALFKLFFFLYSVVQQESPKQILSKYAHFCTYLEVLTGCGYFSYLLSRYFLF
jgi:uncharacterized membrane protein YozB (DUF420 family)